MKVTDEQAVCIVMESNGWSSGCKTPFEVNIVDLALDLLEARKERDLFRKHIEVIGQVTSKTKRAVK